MNRTCPKCGKVEDLEEFARLNNCSVEEVRKKANYCGKCGYRLSKTHHQKIIEEEITECVTRIMSRLGLKVS
jgi:C4-type Zn-finger protein